MSVGRKGALLAALSAAFAAPAVSAAAPAGAPQEGGAAAQTAAGGSHSKVSRAGCANGVVARIAGKRTCLKSGKRCSRRYQKQYKRNGYVCKRDSAGKYRLKKRKMEF